jgi:hypothetical protein
MIPNFPQISKKRGNVGNKNTINPKYTSSKENHTHIRMKRTYLRRFLDGTKKN